MLAKSAPLPAWLIENEYGVTTSILPCEKCARVWQESSINDTVMLSPVGLTKDTKHITTPKLG